MTDKPTPNSDPFSEPSQRSDRPAPSDSLLSHSVMPPSTSLPPPQTLSPSQPPLNAPGPQAVFGSSPFGREDPPPVEAPAGQQPAHFWQPPQAPAGQQPAHFWQQPQAPGWATAYPYAPARASNRSNKMVTALGLLIAAAGAVGAIVVASQSGGTGKPADTGRSATTAANGIAVTADTPLKPDLGASIYSDDFRDSASGWTTAPTNSGTTYKYTSDGYVAAALGDLHHFVYAPYHSARQQLSMTVKATQSPGAPSGAGFGVSCRRGSGSAMLIYEFLVFSDGSWAVERRDGAPDVNTGPRILEEGAGDAIPGATPLTVQGVCATVDSNTTRLALYVDGLLAIDTTDADYGMPSDAWQGGIDISSRESAGQTVTVTSFEERDLSQ